MQTNPEYQELIDYLKREGQTDAEIEKILARVRQYEIEMKQDSIMDAIGDGSLDLEALIKEAARTVNLSRICLWTVCFVALSCGCAPKSVGVPAASSSEGNVKVEDALVQFSLLAALAADDYSGGAKLTEVLANGSFGVGTFDRLDGEMIVLDGEIYQALSDGTVREADLKGTAPFASVTFFNEDGRIDDFSAATLEHVDQQLDRRLPRQNWPYAIRIDGQYAEVTVRSVPAQTPPFRPLVEVVKEQPTWEHKNVRGTLIGTRCPAWMGTLNVSGYHWHFLSDDRTIGGHVLQCNLEKGTVIYDECSSVVIRLPDSEEFATFRMEEVTQGDVDRIERQRGRE